MGESILFPVKLIEAPSIRAYPENTGGVFINRPDSIIAEAVRVVGKGFIMNKLLLN